MNSIVTRGRKHALAQNGFNRQPSIRIIRDMTLETVLLKKGKIVKRRHTLVPTTPKRSCQNPKPILKNRRYTINTSTASRVRRVQFDIPTVIKKNIFKIN